MSISKVKYMVGPFHEVITARGYSWQFSGADNEGNNYAWRLIFHTESRTFTSLAERGRRKDYASAMLSKRLDLKFEQNFFPDRKRTTTEQLVDLLPKETLAKAIAASIKRS
jgi:hypothetical protein